MTLNILGRQMDTFLDFFFVASSCLPISLLLSASTFCHVGYVPRRSHPLYFLFFALLMCSLLSGNDAMIVEKKKKEKEDPCLSLLTSSAQICPGNYFFFPLSHSAFPLRLISFAFFSYYVDISKRVGAIHTLHE